jgi:hypothetical protein
MIGHGKTGAAFLCAAVTWKDPQLQTRVWPQRDGSTPGARIKPRAVAMSLERPWSRAIACRPGRVAARAPTRHPGGMLRARHVLALIATIMLVIGGAPARATQSPCNPCPPDCPMMSQMHMGADAHGQQAPAKGRADNPCKQGLACQVSTSPLILSQASSGFVLTVIEADLRPLHPKGRPSRPPDPTLRPPRQL